MRGVVAIGALAGLLGCQGRPQLVGREDLGASELRIILTRTEQTSEVRALGIDTPYRYEAEPLDTVFDREDALEVTVFGFTRAQLLVAFPGLGDRSTAEIIEILGPELGPPAPGRYAPPAPEAVLTARLEADSPSDFDYEPLAWDAARSREDLQFAFALPAEIACAPVESPMRVFNRAEPSTVCIYARNAECEWTSGGCPDTAAVFGAPLPAGQTIRETPARALSFGAEVCEPLSETEPGETRAWRCGGEIVAAQEQVASAEGGPWLVEQGTPLSTPELAAPHRFEQSVRGLLIAAEQDGAVVLRRLEMKEGAANYHSFESPVLDGLSSTQDPARASSADGTSVTLSRDFDARVGVSNLQCFVAETAGRQDDSSFIAGKPAFDRIDLTPPGLGTPLAETFSWRVIGDPGPDFLTSPPVVDVPPFDLGSIQRFTRSRAGNLVALHGSTHTFRLLRLADRFPNDLNYFTCAVKLPRPANLVGEIVAGATGFYAVTGDGIDVLDPSGAPTDRLGTDRTFLPDHRIEVVEGPDGGDRVLVWQPLSAELHHFDRTGAVDRTETVDGEIAAVLDGPTVIYRPANERHAVVVWNVARDEQIRIAVPPFVEAATGQIQIDPGGAIALAGGRIMIGYTDGDHAGVVDVESGLSQAIQIASGGRLTTVFEDDGQDAIWALLESPAQPSQVELLRFPFPAP